LTKNNGNALITIKSGVIPNKKHFLIKTRSSANNSYSPNKQLNLAHLEVKYTSTEGYIKRTAPIKF